MLLKDWLVRICIQCYSVIRNLPDKWLSINLTTSYQKLGCSLFKRTLFPRMPPKTILRPPPLLKANPPDPAMFLQSSRMRKSDSSSIHSSTSTLKEELETLSHVRDRLTLANARSNDSITNSISSFASMSDSNLSEKFDLMSVKGRILNEGLPRKSYRNDASLEAKECERALSYMDRYKRVKSGKSRHALHNEWNSSTKLTDLKSKREASKPKTALRRSSVPTDSITKLDASNESINTITAQSIDASVASGLGDNSTRALDEGIPETRPNSAKPISNDDDFKKLSYSSIKEAPSLTSLSTVKPEIASVPPVHLSAVCKGCAIPIRSHEASLSAMGFLWHPSCFKCANSQCGESRISCFSGVCAKV
ncbi:hypothetical protein BCR33DRAFT_493134 [Rhizoclosmatium globosum]|uniref:LIM zinc-binding domain-containing protein n=1 Tax=Rhizoclosmatium globosum TaxID=329046 RepID=A0A1Y2CUT7_9FUNG|nr:hypothetical protein BCR33DRAFT_493134 [Rhizoclosmatium globosum]|eukprot:ORY50727.1 hypothetical protein BCR33DRAFT_493134 [Rhizoclosmatium globosum]